MIGMERRKLKLKGEETSSKHRFDVIRTLRLTSYSFFISGVLMHIVYTKILPKIAPGCGMIAVVKKVLFTQTVFMITGTCLFYFILALSEG
jgi:hypothetical protein